MQVDLLDRVIGSEEGDDGDVEDINTGEPPMMLTVGTDDGRRGNERARRASAR